VGLRSRDSVCSGNCNNGLHFLDLLAKSMPVPYDTDTDLCFIPLSVYAHVRSLSLSCVHATAFYSLVANMVQKGITRRATSCSTRPPSNGGRCPALAGFYPSVTLNRS
jgi:hypothetical protein